MIANSIIYLRMNLSLLNDEEIVYVNTYFIFINTDSVFIFQERVFTLSDPISVSDTVGRSSNIGAANLRSGANKYWYWIRYRSGQYEIRKISTFYFSQYRFRYK